MKNIKFLMLLIVTQFAMQTFAQRRNIEEVDYRRSSIYSIIINHTEQKLGENIADVFINMPLPDKYNDHDLSVKIVTVDQKLKQKERGEDFLTNNYVASHLVARWFNRNPLTGECDVELIKSRGLYDASELDKELASQSARGMAMLEDAGEELIHNTFVLVNDIRYIDKENQGKIAGIILNAVSQGLGMGEDFGNALQAMMETLKGFKVKVHTYLYRLVWDEETAMTFYETMYSDAPNAEKKAAFESNRDKFKLEYVGSQLSSGSDVSFMGVNLDTPEEMIRKACVRAIDENVANLARNFEPFKVKVKLTSADPIQAPIGMKEEITEKTTFEVLVPEIKNNKTTYRQVALIRPKKNMIWDNRYMAKEEGAVGSTLNYTTFEKISGGTIQAGMLIRELKSK